MKINGIKASAGIAKGRVLKIIDEIIEIDKQFSSVEIELKKYFDAKKEVEIELESIVNKLEANQDENAAIFSAHIDMLQDPIIAEELENLIKLNKLSAMAAVDDSYQKYINMFSNMDDEYMKERSSDLKDLRKKILARIAKVKLFDLSNIDKEVIIVAKDLTPSQTARINKKYVLAFATNIGGATSHSAIMARSLNIPAVVGLESVFENTSNDDLIIVDGSNGSVILKPNSEEEKAFERQFKEYQEYLISVKEFKNKPSLTLDKHKVELAANIGNVVDMDNVIENDAEAVGLFRSEFLFMDSNNWPSEELQFKSYSDTIKKFNDKNKKIVVRTLDIGGDKTLNYFKFPYELNPFLGYRAIRMSLSKPEIFKTQLRALIRASQFGKIGIMFPMITNVNEFKDAKEIFETTYKELEKEKVIIGKRSNIEIGLMIETPAAAVLSDKFAKHADFLSIGTNDLIQYTMAADRMNETMSYLYQPLNPSILRLIKMVIDGGKKGNAWVGMCGEMAGDHEAIPLLLGLGLYEFSMSASSILPARKLISSLNYEKAKEMALKALDLETEKEVKDLLKSYLKD
ncbi:phosphotransferase system enzyme I (PtsI) [Mycoplasma testudineum]|uniref:Phosphoenolpyruvate-protein phosphotransferase n=1 Tax=Mycoplasma testudineum TaxID=244584 RepID=A0A4R6IAC5_9MOLU|nr:phosphoenolpyruvate--protein phosphotransferase [Mycoplasma testudineum]OYD26522.1 phosphoenolpyruvate--protein phosphotransferase [Mycoplasma testudineum]TDO19140.1 phosphotransferase system enzyme I (PtsI) [Mycoplasma testudineum]